MEKERSDGTGSDGKYELWWTWSGKGMWMDVAWCDRGEEHWWVAVAPASIQR